MDRLLDYQHETGRMTALGKVSGLPVRTCAREPAGVHLGGWRCGMGREDSRVRRAADRPPSAAQGASTSGEMT